MNRDQLITEIAVLFATQGYQMPDIWVETLSDEDLAQVFDQLRDQVYETGETYIAE